MTTVDILFEGYARLSEDASKMFACGSCALIRTTNKTSVLFDTLGPWERDKLAQALSKLSIHPSDVDYVVCSHSHPDHIGNLNLFTSTKTKLHVVGTSVYSNDEYHLDKFEPIGSYEYIHEAKQPNTTKTVIKYQELSLAQASEELSSSTSSLKIIPTPGHTQECVSMIVNDSKLGSIGLVGDLFENEKDVHDEGVWLAAGSQNQDFQRANRAMIYNMVDYILPGHGPMFKTENKLG